MYIYTYKTQYLHFYNIFISQNPKFISKLN